MTDSFSSPQVARALLEIGAVGISPDEPVTFKSGVESPVYVDSRRLIFHPEQWRVVVDDFRGRWERGDFDAEVIAGVETSGIPYSSVFAFSVGVPSVFVRKPSREHRRRIEGGDVADRRVLLVEDMISTGENSLSAVAALRQAGGIVTDCLALIAYGFPDAAERFTTAGVRMHTLADFPSVVNEAVRSGQVTPEEAVIILRWLDDPYGLGRR
ncbi:MAG: orotate phosphoribosyltransferase [Anaerolineae bacterium]|nr:orotate phosphoribosyltransferase [Anaerolineae bacterium]NUQ04269.1 orotate phosphoribosyltransferase [Anaerolineae bacterium]